jgi:hypothetical protein
VVAMPNPIPETLSILNPLGVARFAQKGEINFAATDNQPKTIPLQVEVPGIFTEAFGCLGGFDLRINNNLTEPEPIGEIAVGIMISNIISNNISQSTVIEFNLELMAKSKPDTNFGYKVNGTIVALR